jgi:hypothetical protein
VLTSYLIPSITSLIHIADFLYIIVSVINKDNIFISNIYKDIIYLILSINTIKSLKAKGKGLQIA